MTELVKKDMTLEEMEELRLKLRAEIPDGKITPPDLWTLNQKKSFTEHQYLNHLIGLKIQKEFKEKYGFTD